jgi:hypothetical protein
MTSEEIITTVLEPLFVSNLQTLQSLLKEVKTPGTTLYEVNQSEEGKLENSLKKVSNLFENMWEKLNVT